MSVPHRELVDPMFGHPKLRAANNARVYWSRANALSQWQKGSGWQVAMYGGVQTGDDWAAMFVPVKELDIAGQDSFGRKPTRWSYYMTNAETFGLNIVIWVHDPNDGSKRAEITQRGQASGLGKASGWNSHTFNPETDQMFFSGENTGDSDLTAGTDYTWAEFQADVMFKTWTIYRISIECGWQASGTFEEAWLAEFMLNGTRILLEPREGDLVPVKQKKT
ncbi:MAG: hypothetical protein V3S51_07840, partial [Dehalococcoidia bacterium]